MVNKSLKTAPLNLRVSPALKKAVSRLAKARRRSITAFVEDLIFAELKKKRRM